MRGIIRVTIIYELESDTDWYTKTDYYDIDPNDSEEMKLVKGVKADFEDHEGPYEDLCLPGGEIIDSVEFKKWL